jgi:hypothetical protein
MMEFNKYVFDPSFVSYIKIKSKHHYKSWFFKRFKLTNLSFLTNGHVHLIKGQGIE